MFDRFSVPARRVIFWALHEAGKLGADAVEPEHLLAGWLNEDQHDGLLDGQRPLDIYRGTPFLSADCARRLRAMLAASTPPGTPKADNQDMPVAKDAKRALTAAMQNTSGTVGLLHILWGLIIDEDTSVSRLLRENGVTLEQVAKAIQIGDQLMTVGVTGAGGKLGTSLVSHTLGKVPASKIVAITRDPAKLGFLSQQDVQVRAGDFNDPAGLPAAFAGIDRLMIIPTGDLVPGVRTKQHTAAIQAAVAAGVSHITYISTVSPRPDPNNVLLDSHFATEQALIASGAAWTILRMNVYMDTLVDAAKRAIAAGSYAAVPGAPAAYVVRDDVAAAAAGILATSGHEGITYHATGPASIGQPEIAAAIAKASGKPVAFTAITEAEQRAGLEAAGLPAFLVDTFAGFQAALRAGAFDLVTGDVERLSGKRAQSPADFFARALG